MLKGIRKLQCCESQLLTELARILKEYLPGGIMKSAYISTCLGYPSETANFDGLRLRQKTLHLPGLSMSINKVV
jgi:hypothetical protein